MEINLTKGASRDYYVLKWKNYLFLDEIGEKSPFGRGLPVFRSGSMTILKVESGIGRLEIK